MGNPVQLKATVTEVIPYGTGVYQVRLRPESWIPRFRAGQILHLALDGFCLAHGFWLAPHVFSITLGPDTECLEIVCSVKGRYTSGMQREIAVGYPVWLRLPGGSLAIS
jgi:NAD(P)H-flavin reductase